MKKAVGILFILLGISSLVVMLLNFPTNGAEDHNKTFVSSFVVDGVDQGAGYFYNRGSVSNPEYHFTDQSGKETIYFEVDNYTIDNNKQEEASQNSNNYTAWLFGIIFLPAIFLSTGFCMVFIDY